MVALQAIWTVEYTIQVSIPKGNHQMTRLKTGRVHKPYGLYRIYIPWCRVRYFNPDLPGLGAITLSFMPKGNHQTSCWNYSGCTASHMDCRIYNPGCHNHANSVLAYTLKIIRECSTPKYQEHNTILNTMHNCFDHKAGL